MADRLTDAQRRAVAAAVVAAASAACGIHERYLNREDYHDSKFTGRQWVQDLLNGHELRMRDALGIESQIFKKLCHQLFMISGLSDSRSIDLEEKVAMFLYLGVHNSGHRDIAERFQHSTNTVSVCVAASLRFIPIQSLIYVQHH